MHSKTARSDSSRRCGISPVSSRWQGFWLAQGLGVCLLLMSYLRIAGDTQSMLFSDQVLDVLFAGPIWGTKLGYNLVGFGLSMLLLHVLFGLGCWLMGRASVQAWPTAGATIRQYVLIWFLVFSIGLLAFFILFFVWQIAMEYSHHKEIMGSAKSEAPSGAALAPAE